MTEDRPQDVAPANTVNVAVLGVLGIWSAVLILPGAMNMSEPWGSTCLVTGAVALVATIVGGVSRSWMGALYAVLLATAGGMIATSNGGAAPRAARSSNTSLLPDARSRFIFQLPATIGRLTVGLSWGAAIHSV